MDALKMAVWLIIFQTVVVIPLISLYYILYIPSQTNRYCSEILARTNSLGSIAYKVAYPLTILRLPYALIPYLAKTFIWFLIGPKREIYWSYPLPQFLRTIGDWANLVFTSGLIVRLTSEIEAATPIIVVCLLAEYIRLAAEKGQMLFSAGWQMLPHRRIAQSLSKTECSWLKRCFAAYIRYYQLSDADRIRYIEGVVAHYTSTNQAAQKQLRYFHGFEIVSPTHPLWSGVVRNVSRGTVYIHRHWSNEPWLLIGQALRRSSWIYDPRILPRPFYYWSQANVLMTLFVLQNARLSPPYAFYQWGNQIKVARNELFHRILGYLNLSVEQHVRADGSYDFQPLELSWIHKRLYAKSPDVRALWNEDETVDEILSQGFESLPTQMEIAERFTFPSEYVDEVLYKKIETAWTRSACSRTVCSRTVANE